MRKLKLQMQLTVDSFVATSEGEMGWMVWNWDDQLKGYVLELTRSVDTILLGRKLADGFIKTWAETAANEKTSDEFSRRVVDCRKIVFTHTLEKSQWPNTVLAKGNLRDEVQKLKEAPGKDMIAYGGGSFVTSLIANNLIDEYFLFVNPVLLGKGMTIFQQVKGPMKLRQVDSIKFQCGITCLHFVKEDIVK